MTVRRPGLLLALVWLACSAAHERPRNLLLISLDTLRADRLGAYGYHRPTSPHLDRLAASGTLFENATTQAPWTLPSHASLLTGLLPHHHGVVTDRQRLPEAVPTLAETLAAAGYRTAAVVTSQWLGPKYGLRRGFAQFRSFLEILAHGEEVTQIAIDWLEQLRSEPFFLFLHYYDVHSPYTPKAPFRQEFVREYHGIATGQTYQLDRVRRGKLKLDARDARYLSDLYDAEILQLDAQLARLFEALETTGLLDETLVVITSDHGEEFLEHGGVLHGRTFFEEMVRVPLIIAGPGVARGRRVAEPVMLVDVAPTALARLGVPVPSFLDGVDLLDDARGDRDRPRLVFSAADWKNESPDRKRMLRSGHHKLIFDRITEQALLYDLEADPLEQHNLARKQPERVQALVAELPRFTEHQREAGAAPERSAEEEQLLRDLGYVE